jgi:hypothetical protein
MQEISIVDALRALATSAEIRPETARLRDIFNDVEAALAAGVSRADVHKTLQKYGFKMTLRGFETALYRIRKQRKQSGSRYFCESFYGHPCPTNKILCLKSRLFH